MTVTKHRFVGKPEDEVLNCDYLCNFCGYTTKDVEVRKSGRVQKQTASTQIRCINCENFLKTYE